MTCIPGLASISSGKAVRPSMRGISMSRMTTSTGDRRNALTAICPSLTDEATTTFGWVSSSRVNSPRTTAESSAIITRNG
jgi:hypothetical protein